MFLGQFATILADCFSEHPTSVYETYTMLMLLSLLTRMGKVIENYFFITLATAKLSCKS